MIDKPGIFSALPMGTYLADPCPAPSLSSSIAVKLLQDSPFHAWAHHARNPKCIPRKASKEMNLGTVAHALALEKSVADVVVIDPKDYPSRPKRKGEAGSIPRGWTNVAIKEARGIAIEDGKTPLLPDEMQTCRNMVEALLEYVERSEIRGVFDHGESEVTAIAQEGPVWLRCRPDWITHDKSIIVHLKTTARSAKPERFARGLLPSMGYDLALAFYQRVIAGAVGGSTVPRYCILVQEQTPPYCPSLVSLNPEYESIMVREIETAVTTWRECMRTNRWPAYPTRIHYAEPKPWQIAEVEEREIEGFLGTPDPLQIEYGVQA